MGLAIQAVGGVADEPELPSYGAQLVRMLLSLGGILVVLLLVAKLIPRVSGRGEADVGDALEVVASRRLDARTRLVLVRAGGEHVLIATGDGPTVKLASGPALDPAFESATGEGARTWFESQIPQRFAPGSDHPPMPDPTL